MNPPRSPVAEVVLADEPPIPMGTEETVTMTPWPPGWEDDDEEDENDPDEVL